MQTLEIAIYTGDARLLKNLVTAITRCFMQFQVTAVCSTYQDWQILKEKLIAGIHYDLLLLDIDPEAAGLEVAAEAGRRRPQPLLVFLSEESGSSSRILRHQPFRVLHKKNLESELAECIRGIVKEVPDTLHTPWLMLSGGHGLYRFNVNQIRYIESQDKYVNVVTDRGVSRIRYALGNVEELLGDHHFLRIHKSYLVNAHVVYAVCTKEVVLDDDTSLPLSRYRAGEVKKKFEEISRWNIL